MLNPVSQLSTLARLLQNHKDSSINVSTCTHANEKSQSCAFTQSQVLSRLRSTVTSTGKDVLGFTPNDIGTKSIRSSATMGWHLSGESQISIQLMGRWKSEAWLFYIGISSITYLRFPKGFLRVALVDPCTPSDTSNGHLSHYPLHLSG